MVSFTESSPVWDMIVLSLPTFLWVLPAIKKVPMNFQSFPRVGEKTFPIIIALMKDYVSTGHGGMGL